MFKNLRKIRVIELIMICFMIYGSRQAFAEEKDPYVVLGVERSASTEDIKKVYRKQVRRWHPDLHPEVTADQANEKAGEINRAWDILSDPVKRAEYDRTGKVSNAPPKSKLAEVIEIVARYQSQDRTWRLENDMTHLQQFTTDEEIEALRIAAAARRSAVRHDYSHLLKFESRNQVEALRIAAPIFGNDLRLYYSDLVQFKEPNQVEALRVVAEYRQGSLRNDFSELLKFKSKVSVDALKAATSVLKGRVHNEYAHLLTIDDPRLVESLKAAFSAEGYRFNFTSFIHDELRKAKERVASRIEFTDVETFMADVSAFNTRYDLDRRALKDFLTRNQSRIFKFNLDERQLGTLSRISGSSSLAQEYRKFQAQHWDEIDYKMMLDRLESNKSKIIDRAGLDEIVSKASSPAKQRALTRFLILNPTWIAHIQQSGQELLKFFAGRDFGEEFRRQVAIEYLKNTNSKSDYLTLTRLNDSAERGPWRNLIAATVNDFLRLKPNLAEIQRALQVKNLGESGYTLALAAIDQASSYTELRALVIPAEYRDYQEVKNRFRDRANALGQTGPQKCFTIISDLLKKLTRSTN